MVFSSGGLRNAWFRGSKAAFAWLLQHDSPAYALFERAARPGASETSEPAHDERTDAHGHFRFAGLPPGLDPRAVRELVARVELDPIALGEAGPRSRV